MCQTVEIYKYRKSIKFSIKKKKKKNINKTCWQKTMLMKTVGKKRARSLIYQ